MKRIPDRLTIGGQTFEGKRMIVPNGVTVDLEQVFGQTERGATAYLFASLTAEQEMDIEIGSGADWFMKWWLDGEPLYDTLTTGNREFPIAAINHVFKAHLSPGEHVLTACVVRGSASFAFAAGEAQKARGQEAEAEALAARRAAYSRLLQDKDHGPNLRAKARLGLARTYSEEGEYAAAREEYDKILALRASPGSDELDLRLVAKAHLETARTYLQEREYAQARETYERVLFMQVPVEDKAVARSGIGETYLGQRDFAAAATQYQSAVEDLKLDPERYHAAISTAEGKRKFADLLARMRKDHPRLFMNEEMWPEMKARALGEGMAAYDKMRSIANGLPPLEDIGVEDWGRGSSHRAPLSIASRATRACSPRSGRCCGQASTSTMTRCQGTPPTGARRAAAGCRGSRPWTGCGTTSTRTNVSVWPRT